MAWRLCSLASSSFLDTGATGRPCPAKRTTEDQSEEAYETTDQKGILGGRERPADARRGLERRRAATGICARICARDAAAQVEIGETGKGDVDLCRTFTEVSGASGDRARRQRRPSYCS